MRLWQGALAVVLVTVGALMLAWFPSWIPHATVYNNYVFLADALMHGHVWIAPPGPWIDALSYNGTYYVIEGPMPAILLLPAIPIWGLLINQTLLSFALTALAAAAGWMLAQRLGTPVRSRIVLTLFLLFGTDLFFCGVYGDVWYLAHVSAVCFTLFALVEVTGKKRGWLVMLWAICAAFSRFSLVLAIPVYVFLLMHDVDREARRSRLIGAGALALAGVALWIAYNQARWGVWYDVGYTAWYHQDTAGQPTGSPFRPEYLPMQLYAFFVLPPQILQTFPYVAPTQYGLALPYTSPGLLLAFFARRPVVLVLALWSATLLTAAPNFLYYVIGFTQFGMRHALDFEPFLFALMCLSARNGLRWWGNVLCLYSAAAGIWGVWFWNTFVRHTYVHG